MQYTTPAIFPTEIYPMTNFSHEEQLTSARYALKLFKTRHRRHVKWLAACDAYHADLEKWAAENGTDVATAYQTAWRTAPELARPKGRCPSRESAKRQYDDAAYLIRVMGWDFTTNTRCHSMQDLSNLLVAAENALKSA